MIHINSNLTPPSTVKQKSFCQIQQNVEYLFRYSKPSTIFYNMYQVNTVLFVIQVEVSCGQFSCNQIPAIELKLGRSFLSYATGAHRTGSQGSIIGKVFQGWIDVLEYFDGGPHEFLL